jgi:hypothetical protein
MGYMKGDGDRRQEKLHQSSITYSNLVFMVELATQKNKTYAVDRTKSIKYCRVDK